MKLFETIVRLAGFSRASYMLRVNLCSFVKCVYSKRAVLLTDNQHLLVDGGCREGWSFHCHFAAEVTGQVETDLPEYDDTLV